MRAGSRRASSSAISPSISAARASRAATCSRSQLDLLLRDAVISSSRACAASRAAVARGFGLGELDAHAAESRLELRDARGRRGLALARVGQPRAGRRRCAATSSR